MMVQRDNYITIIMESWRVPCFFVHKFCHVKAMINSPTVIETSDWEGD